MLIGTLLNKLQKVKTQGDKSYLACCPSHPDKNPSLHISLKDDTILLKCFSGCSTEDICKALGLTLADLFHKADPVKPVAASRIVATYDYQDEKGAILYQAVRYDPKSFRQRRPDGKGGWSWDMDGVRRVLYHLPMVQIAEEVYVVEGEKDADNLDKAGVIATTSVGGANNWREEYAQALAGKTVTIIPDKDGPGMAYARQVANSLVNKAKSVRVVPLPGDGVKDVSDWLAAGGKVGDLVALEQPVEVLFTSDKPAYRQVEDTIQWDKKVGALLLTFKSEKLSEERTGIHARVSILGQHEMLSWSYLNVERREDRSSLAGAAHSALKSDETYSKDDLRHDLDAFCAGLWEFHLSRFVPEELTGDETPQPIRFILFPYIIASGGTIIYAPPGRGKSFTAVLWGVSVDAGCRKFWRVERQKVLMINLERSAESLRRRLSAVNRVLGLPPARPLLTLNARGKSLNEVLPACRRAVQKYSVGLIILDSISRAGLGDLNENQSGNRVIDALSALCPTWVALGHTGRASEDHLYGSVMQDAGADVCVQLASQVKDDGTLGVGWQITKQNDIGYHAQCVYALEFDANGLKCLRPAKTYEFPEVEGKAPTNMEGTIIDWILGRDTADASATEVERDLGYHRVNVSKLFTQSGKFIQTRRVRQSVFYGVKGSFYEGKLLE